MSKDYYKILGVPKNASEEDVKTAFRKKAHEHHPDKGGDAEKFKEINEAYQVLGNKQKRQQYDKFGSDFQNGQAGGFSGFQNGGGFSGFQNGAFHMDFDDLGDMFGGFGDIFGFNGSNTRSQRATSGNDLKITISLTLTEAAFGLEKKLTFTKNVVCDRCHGQGAEPGSKIETCPTCHGHGRVSKIQRTILGNIQTQTVCPTCGGEGKIYSQPCTKCGGRGVNREKVSLKVKIPAGIDSGETIRLSGQGEAGLKGAPAGNLYLYIQVLPDNHFKRRGYDIITEETINLNQAILGDKIEIATLHGPVKLKIPEGTQSGTVFKIRGKGTAKLHGRGFGSQLTKINVKIPGNLNKKQKQLLSELNL